jgi:phage shock protein A
MSLSDIANGEYASPGRDRDDLPSEVLSVLPSDPFEQLDLARKIITVAFEKRLHSENGSLRAELNQKDRDVKELRERVRELETKLKSTSERLTGALEEQVGVPLQSTLCFFLQS